MDKTFIMGNHEELKVAHKLVTSLRIPWSGNGVHPDEILRLADAGDWRILSLYYPDTTLVWHISGGTTGRFDGGLDELLDLLSYNCR